jgi:hypothetical protein
VKDLRGSEPCADQDARLGLPAVLGLRFFEPVPGQLARHKNSGFLYRIRHFDSIVCRAVDREGIELEMAAVVRADEIF